MKELADELEAAFESEGYDVSDVTINRKQLRLSLREEDASASDLQEITYSVVDEDDILGLDVTTESVEGTDDVTTVVSFRYRG